MVKFVSTLLRLWLGSLFVYSASLKLVRYKNAGKTVRLYGVLPAHLGNATGFALPWVELTTGLSLMFGRSYILGPVLGTLLGSSFTYASYNVLQRKIDIPCNCTGSIDERVTGLTLNRGVAITFCGLLLLSLGKRNYVRLPTLPVLAGTGVSLLPSVLVLYRTFQHSQFHKKQIQRKNLMIEQLAQILTEPPASIPEPVANSNQLSENQVEQHSL